MSSDELERLSALLDDETEHSGGLLDRVREDAEMRGKWARYHLIGECLRGEAISSATHCVAARVSERLAEEPTILAPTAISPKRHWQRTLAGAAIAASVATLAVMVTPQFLDSPAEVDGGAPALASSTPPGALPQYFMPQGSTHWVAEEGNAEEEALNRLLMQHNEFAIQGTLPGVLPYASFVSYDNQR